MKALIISADDFEDAELFVPYYHLKEAGIEVDVASMDDGIIIGMNGHHIDVSRTLGDVDPDEYDLLFLPGGKAAENIMKEKEAMEIARHFFEKNKPVAAICNGAQTLINAGLLKGRYATCSRSVAEDLKRAGGNYKDIPVIVDGNLVTSREPRDLPAFMCETLKQLRL